MVLIGSVVFEFYLRKCEAVNNLRYPFNKIVLQEQRRPSDNLLSSLSMTNFLYCLVSNG